MAASLDALRLCHLFDPGNDCGCGSDDCSRPHNVLWWEPMLKKGRATRPALSYSPPECQKRKLTPPLPTVPGARKPFSKYLALKRLSAPPKNVITNCSDSLCS